MNRDEWLEENERLERIINGGKFLNAKQGLEIGKAFAEGLEIGLNNPVKFTIRSGVDELKRDC